MARVDPLGHHRFVDERGKPAEIVPDDEPTSVRVEDAGTVAAPPAPGRRPFRRRSQNKIVGGVCGGLADHFGVSVLGLRIAFGFGALVVAFLILRPWLGPGYGYPYSNPNLSSFRALVKLGSTLAVLSYFALWVFVPSDDAGVSAVGRVRRRIPRVANLRPWFAMLALVLGASILGSYLDLWSGDVTWAFLFIGVGIMLFRRDAERNRLAGDGGAEHAEPTPSTSHIPAPPGPPGSPAAESTALPRTPRERSPLGWLVLGILLLAVGGAAILQNLGALHLRPVRYPAMAFLILGAGLLVGAFVGRARWLVLPAIPIVPVLLVLSLIHVPLEGGFGKIAVYARGPGEAAGSYRRIGGDVFVDLTRLQCGHEHIDLSESTAFGDVTLYAPFDAHVVATGSVGLGNAPFTSDVVVDHSFRSVLEPRFGDGPTITADLEAGVGSVQVYREYVTKKQAARRCA